MANFEKYHYDKMLLSFKSNFLKDPNEEIEYRETFEFLASKLKTLNILDVYVDVSKISHSIDFCMNLGRKVLLTVGMNAFERVNNDVMYAVYQAGELMVMNICSLTELMEMATDMQKDFLYKTI